MYIYWISATIVKKPVGLLSLSRVPRIHTVGQRSPLIAAIFDIKKRRLREVLVQESYVIAYAVFNRKVVPL